MCRKLSLQLGDMAPGSHQLGVLATLFLSEGTVRNNLSSAIGKTWARTRAQAVHFAAHHGWL